MRKRKKIALLNDYQNIALEMADWSQVIAIADITVFTERFASVYDAATALVSYDIMCLMRERTPVPRDFIKRLSRL